MQLIFPWLMRVFSHQLFFCLFFFFSEETVKELLLIAPMLCFTRPVMSLRAEHNRTRLHRLLCRDRARVAEGMHPVMSSSKSRGPLAMGILH